MKWIGDEAMLAFADLVAGLAALDRLLPACRAEPRLLLTWAAFHYGPVIRRGSHLRNFVSAYPSGASDLTSLL